MRAASVEPRAKSREKRGEESSGAGPLTLDTVFLAPTALRSALCYIVFFLSGTAGLVYEISWSRQIGLLFGHALHVAAVVLASYFAGMAVGNLAGAK